MYMLSFLLLGFVTIARLDYAEAIHVIPIYGDCGTAYNPWGPDDIVCAEGCYCKYINAFRSQCLPGSSTTDTTAVAASTTVA
ncbi:hypothetical protein BDQ17DRAFT_1539641 [Cyathus striatus]|nr:hypothetical protein BDQ17DRAFT_1539641 [Cyathus striatus]